ncbi:hypothetical protein [Lewinella sp. LCG006]|uniref:hypothetical protein n=1 Tax=Lewinella sp. LCG006 TaxID=3231911 RepID=UPI00345F81DF
MAKYEVKSDAAVFTIKYRAICMKRDYRGDWRESIDQAYDDALQHQSENKSHEIDIEVEQKQSYAIKIDEKFKSKFID